MPTKLNTKPCDAVVIIENGISRVVSIDYALKHSVTNPRCPSCNALVRLHPAISNRLTKHGGMLNRAASFRHIASSGTFCDRAKSHATTARTPSVCVSSASVTVLSIRQLLQKYLMQLPILRYTLMTETAIELDHRYANRTQQINFIHARYQNALKKYPRIQELREKYRAEVQQHGSTTHLALKLKAKISVLTEDFQSQIRVTTEQQEYLLGLGFNLEALRKLSSSWKAEKIISDLITLRRYFHLDRWSLMYFYLNPADIVSAPLNPGHLFSYARMLKSKEITYSRNLTTEYLKSKAELC